MRIGSPLVQRAHWESPNARGEDRKGGAAAQRCPVPSPTGNEPRGRHKWEVRDYKDGRGAVMTPQGSSCSMPGRNRWQPPTPDKPQRSQSRHAPGRREVISGHRSKRGRPLRGPDIHRGGRTGRPKGGGCLKQRGGGVEDLPLLQHRMYLSALEGGRPPPRRKAWT